MTTTESSREPGRITLTHEQRDLLRHEAVLAISGDAIGDHLDKPGHYDWAREKRAEHELVFKILDDLEWTTEAVWWEYHLRPHPGLGDWLKEQVQSEKRMIEYERKALVQLAAGDEGMVFQDQTFEETERGTKEEIDGALDRINLFTWLLTELACK